MRKNPSYTALLRPTHLLISEKSATYTIKWSYTIIWQVRVSLHCNTVVIHTVLCLLWFHCIRRLSHLISKFSTRPETCSNPFDLCEFLGVLTREKFRNLHRLSALTYLWIPLTHLAWPDFKIKVKQIAHSIVHFDQWNKLISKM